VFLIKLYWSVCICVAQLYGGRVMYRIYYIKNSYMFRPFTSVIFRLRNTYLLHRAESFLRSELVLQLVKKFPASLWIPKVHHRFHKCPPSLPIMSQLHPVSTPSHFPKNYLNIILPSTSRSPQWSLSFRVPHQNPVHTSPLRHTRHMPRPSNSSRFYHQHNIG